MNYYARLGILVFVLAAGQQVVAMEKSSQTGKDQIQEEALAKHEKLLVKFRKNGLTPGQAVNKLITMIQDQKEAQRNSYYPWPGANPTSFTKDLPKIS